jgi:DNA topoisomerase IA
MTELLAKVFKKVSEELPEYEQDAFAEWLLKLIENDERQWDALFAASAEKLEKLADQALTEYTEGRTEVLDLAKLSML